MSDTEFGSDGQLRTISVTENHPYAPPADPEPAKSVDPFEASEPGAAAQRAEPFAAPTPVTAKTRLRDFEDKTFGKGAGRINGHVERGVGSPYARMTDAEKRQYAALEHMVIAEQKVADASAELAKAEAAHDAAIKHVERSEKAAAEPEHEPDGG